MFKRLKFFTVLLVTSGILMSCEEGPEVVLGPTLTFALSK